MTGVIQTQVLVNSPTNCISMDFTYKECLKHGNRCGGKWKNKQLILGKIEHPNGDYYLGEIMRFEPHGFGIYHYYNGEEEKGFWEYNLFIEEKEDIKDILLEAQDAFDKATKGEYTKEVIDEVKEVKEEILNVDIPTYLGPSWMKPVTAPLDKKEDTSSKLLLWLHQSQSNSTLDILQLLELLGKDNLDFQIVNQICLLLISK